MAKLDQATFDMLYIEWMTRHPESDHFVVICPDCHFSAQPGHDCCAHGSTSSVPADGSANH